MPMIIKFIDDIARKKQQDVVFLQFDPPINTTRGSNVIFNDIDSLLGFVNWREHPSRICIVEWLYENKIPWKPCAGFSNSGLITGYQGHIYLDVPYDSTLPESKQHPLLKKCMSFLEDDSGKVKWDGVKFYGLTLETANKITAL